MERNYEKKYEVRGSVLIYQMPQELDHHVAKALCQELDMLVEAFGIRELELNFEKTEFMDSSGIGVIIGRSKTMQFREGRIRVSHLSNRIHMIFQAVGLQKIVEIKGEES